MIDFATLKGVAVPEGNVTQIADASGAVLWKAAPSGATVTLKTVAGYEKDVLIGGQAYRGNAVLTVPIGTVVTFSGFNAVMLNGTPQAMSSAKYDYTVTGDVRISCEGSKPNAYYTVYTALITEL